MNAILRNSTENKRIAEGVDSNATWEERDKKIAIIAARYLNSVGKGENALELAYVLEENLQKKDTSNYYDFIVPEYIKKAIVWICQ